MFKRTTDDWILTYFLYNSGYYQICSWKLQKWQLQYKTSCLISLSWNVFDSLVLGLYRICKFCWHFCCEWHTTKYYFSNCQRTTWIHSHWYEISLQLLICIYSVPVLASTKFQPIVFRNFIRNTEFITQLTTEQ